MSKSGKLREFVKAHPGATPEVIAEGTKLARDFVVTVCRQRVTAGEFTGDPETGYTVNADYVLGKRAALRERKTRAGGGKRPRVASIRELADKHAPTITPATHVRTTLEALRAVLDLDACEPMIMQAFKSHDEAVALMERGGMSAQQFIRNIAELAIGDLVRTPSQRSARVLGHTGGRVQLQYVEADGFEHEGDEVSLPAGLLTLTRRAAPADLPKGFFRQERKHAGPF